MLLHAKWDIYHNIDLQFGGKRSQISHLGDALRVYHYNYSANFSDPSVWPIPIRLWSFQQPLCAILYVLKLLIFCSNWREALPNFEMAVIWEPQNLHRTRTPLANFLFWRATPLQVLAILLLRLLGYNIVPPGCIAPHDIYSILFNSIFISSISVFALKILILVFLLLLLLSLLLLLLLLAR